MEGRKEKVGGGGGSRSLITVGTTFATVAITILKALAVSLSLLLQPEFNQYTVLHPAFGPDLGRLLSPFQGAESTCMQPQAEEKKQGCLANPSMLRKP